MFVTIFKKACNIAEEIESCGFSNTRWRCLPWTMKRAAQQTQAENLNFWMLKTLIFE